MASIHKEIVIEARAEEVWAIIGDFAQGAARMAPDFVVNTRLEGDTRVVTFANGTVARERLVTIDNEARRVVYSIVGDTVVPEHNNSSMQVFADGEPRSRFVWIHDVLPSELAPMLAAAMDDGLSVIKATLESQAVRTG